MLAALAIQSDHGAMQHPQHIIGSTRIYTGDTHPWAKGKKVVIRFVHRGGPDDGQILESDELIGELRPGDVVEFAPVITEPDGTTRVSWVTSDATPDELG